MFYLSKFTKTSNLSNVLEQIRCASQIIPQLSSVKYKVKRKDFPTIQDNDVDYFRSILGGDRVLTANDDVLPHNIDWIRNCRGQSKVVLKPRTTTEVSQILSYCNDKRLPVCPQGGNTGVVGGSVPVFDEVILNMMLMNKIISLDDISGALVCGAGCVLETLDKYAREHGLIMPLDLGAKGSCQVGGNVSTNAGGLRLLRYGNLHGSVLGLKSFEDVLLLYKSAKSSLGEILSAFEMADSYAINDTAKKLNFPNPISDFPFYVILETHGSHEEHDKEKMHRFLNNEMKSGLIVDGTVTSDPSKMQAVWNIRENVAAAGLLGTYMFAYDVSLPLRNYYELVPELRRRLAGGNAAVCGFGHIGDGNVHINVIIPDYNEEVASLLEPYIFEEVSKLGGSISAEHGVGFRKPQYVHYSKDPSAIQLMRDIKTLMDPKGILNPYKVLPDE